MVIRAQDANDLDCRKKKRKYRSDHTKNFIIYPGNGLIAPPFEKHCFKEVVESHPRPAYLWDCLPKYESFLGTTSLSVGVTLMTHMSQFREPFLGEQVRLTAELLGE